ncbi:cation:proton antiporter [Listeria newyorkensis]|uniref:Cation:proton antiporter n=1 Tax=Listeria newyorkensis TaxID=1497681 RepID=A0ABX4XMR1_9LIST|nr:MULTISPECIES: monovalent cation/H(+) antiporter subunit G [Listeria]KGL46745.1 monovalent cation/H+ antiporter subunit G [Listeriaceae bacterium FSL A5-0209]KGL37501.1 monovalent cation/H+ antiporter subunit G [Listeria newyorkensis]KMT62030.1 Na+ H+ antiporter subunit G [Listeria newyorkensis]PNP92158.1 cation:proton antiporter [Listeria newyorkensis]RQW65959.1 Na+/H+ antiporter subunit G [Listeria sp. SHR_NRA_18]
MNVIIEIIISIMILIGASLSILAAIGVIRLPDVYTRTHAAGISNTFGVSLLLFATVGYFFHSGEGFNARVLLAILFIYLTTPIASHLINRAAYDTGVPLAIRIRDQLRSVKKDEIKERKNIIIKQEQLERARQEREELEEQLDWDLREEKIDQREELEDIAREQEETLIELESDDSEQEIIELDEESDTDKKE